MSDTNNNMVTLDIFKKTHFGVEIEACLDDEFKKNFKYIISRIIH